MNIDTAKYANQKEQGKIALTKYGENSIEVSMPRFDPETGAAAPPQRDITTRAQLQAQRDNLQQTLDGLDLLLADIDALK